MILRGPPEKVKVRASSRSCCKKRQPLKEEERARGRIERENEYKRSAVLRSILGSNLEELQGVHEQLAVGAGRVRSDKEGDSV